MAVLVNDVLDSGFYEVSFSAANLPSGTYLYKLQAGDKIETRKMLLVK